MVNLPLFIQKHTLLLKPFFSRNAASATAHPTSSSASPPVYNTYTFSNTAFPLVSFDVSRKGDVPDIPLPLHPYVTRAEFADRVYQLKALFEKYYWQMGMRVYIAGAFLLSILGPWPLAVTIRRAILDRDMKVIDDAQASGSGELPPGTEIHGSDLMLAHLATVLMILGVLFLCWAPYLLYIRSYRRAVSLLTSTWSAASSCKWTIGDVSHFRGRAEVRVRLPLSGTYGAGRNPDDVRGWLPPYMKEQRAAGVYAAPKV